MRTLLTASVLAFLATTTACSSDARPRVSADSGDAAAAATRVPGPSETPMQSPEAYQVVFETSKGAFTVAVTRALAPRGADRFYELATVGYFTDVRFFRLVPGFITQFGIHGDPDVYDEWDNASIQDEPMRTGNTRGTVAFATKGPNSRSVQLFISTGDNRQKLDGQRVFAPIGSVVDGMDVVDALNAEYGEEPNQGRLSSQGNSYIMKWFPALDYIKSATVVRSPESSPDNSP